MDSLSFRALRVHPSLAAAGGKPTVEARLETLTLAELDAGQVVVRVHYSSLNYKDALGISGQGKIYKKLPIVAGIDAAGVVVESSDASLRPGSEVVVTGCGFGENHDGGYSEYARVPAAWVVPLPPGLSLQEAMALGTAGFTAALAVHRLLENAQTPAKGPMLVTGATGGVGSFAISMLAGLGFEVVAVSGKAAASDYLKRLGASRVVTPDSLNRPVRPLESVRWGGGIDNVGGAILAAMLAETELWGNVAAIGLALDHALHTSVMPFILRGVSLLGISSTNCPAPLRRQLWQRLAGDLKPAHLSEVACHKVGLADLPQAVAQLLQRQVTGRYLVDCQKSG